MYIWQNPDWPEFTWDEKTLTPLLTQLSREQGRLLGKMEALGFELRSEAHLSALTEDVIKSSEIEGEELERDQVRSSIARRLGMDIKGLVASDRDVEGVVEMMLDATGKYDQPLTKQRLFDWHASLFPTGRSAMQKILVGKWRDDHDGPMQVVSGPLGKEKVHYEAPAVDRIEKEMKRFFKWFERKNNIDPLLFASLAHLWFVTIHPFEDGNGRIARAIADMALARSEKIGQRFYSMSAQIRLERKLYYEMLEHTQKGTLDITRWQQWFLTCLLGAINGTDDILSNVMCKSRFWDRNKKTLFNVRQNKVLNKLLDGFEGNLSTSKWAKLAKCSQDTAYRDILDLIDKGVLKKEPGGGRSTSYSLEYK